MPGSSRLQYNMKQYSSTAVHQYRCSTTHMRVESASRAVACMALVRVSVVPGWERYASISRFLAVRQ